MTDENDPRLQALQPFIASVKASIANYHATESRLKAATGDRDAAVKAWMLSSADDEATALRDAIERAKLKLRTLAEAAVQDNETSPAEQAKIKAEFEEVQKQLRAASRALRGLAEPFNLDITPLLREMGDPFTPKQPGTSGSGSSAPRPSVYVEVRDNNSNQQWNFENLSGAAKLLESSGLDLEALGKLYAEAAKVDYEEIAKVKEPMEFTWKNPALSNATTYTIKTTPKESARRGRKPASSDPQELPAAS